MRCRALLAGLGLSLACGARTPLLPGGPGDGTGSGGGGGSGGGPTPLAVPCTAALLAGAPTPIRGYCPTRANQASVNGPRAPKIAWGVTPFPIQAPEDFLPAEVVVDPNGRAYVAIDASPQNATGGPNQILAVDPDGSVAWTSSFPSPVGALALGADGHLWFLEEGSNGNVTCPAPCPSSLRALSTDGAPVASIDPPPNGPGFTDLMAIASDGSFFVGSQGSLSRFTTAGVPLWQTYANPGTSLVVGPDDGVIATGSGQIEAYDAAGQNVWFGPQALVAAVGAQGDVVALSSPSGDAVSLVTVGKGGIIAQDVALGAPQLNATELAVAGDGTAIALLANEVSSPGLTKTTVQVIAVDSTGKTRWTTPLDVTLPYDPAALTTHYGLFVDGAGTVVVTAGAVTGIDLASGSVLWTLQPPKAESCLRPAVLAAGGAILATQCDGTVFLARDP
jgi:hypothetical protein